MGLGDAASLGLREREGELARLEASVAAAHRGEGSVALVEGVPGIGKSRLIESAIEIARRADFRVLHARGVEVERELAFGVVRQLLEGTLRAPGSDERAALADGPAALSAAVFDGALLATTSPAHPPSERVGMFCPSSAAPS